MQVKEEDPLTESELLGQMTCVIATDWTLPYLNA